MLDNIAPEVRQNVRRTNRHPSNAQWAGGNEIEGIIEQVNVSLPNGTHYLNEVSCSCSFIFPCFNLCFMVRLFPDSSLLCSRTSSTTLS